MNIQLRQWRVILTVEIMLLVLVVLVVGAILYQTRQTSGLRAEHTTVQTKLAGVQRTLDALMAGQDPDVLRQQIQELQAILGGQTLPTRREALELSTALTDYAAQSGLRIVAMNTADGTVPGANEGEETPVVEVSLEVEGTLAKLIGTLGAVDNFSTAMVQNLGFSAGDDGEWSAKLELAVAYFPTGQEKE
ncbi:MAG: hypothetical protein HY672_00365 [Chloroflexi bacterium]|nr:hypothetical protein [Chloroflexota bacterium]